jgi:hypothetical protein
MAKTAAISVRVPPELKSALESEAEMDHRTLASLVEKILAEWLRGRGASAGGVGAANRRVRAGVGRRT